MAKRLMMVVLLLLFAGFVSAQDTVPVQDAETATTSEPLPAPSGNVATPDVPSSMPSETAVSSEAIPTPVPQNGAAAVDVPLTEEQVSLLNQKIDVGLIDLGRLRTLIESQPGYERITMSLEECIKLALDFNPDLQIVRMERQKSDFDLMMAKGEFDPLLKAVGTYINAVEEASPEYKLFGNIDSYEVFRTSTKTSLAGKLGYGTMYDVTFDFNKEETTFNRFIEEWNGGLTLTLSQPLLRGRGRAANLARVWIGGNAQTMTEMQLRVALMSTLSEVIKAYWDLVGAIEAVTVREQALANAERLLDISNKRLEIGTGAAIDVLQAKAGVVTRQSDLISAQSRVSDAEDLLKQILNMRDGDRFSAKHILPSDRPKVSSFVIDEISKAGKDLDQSIEVALQRRPEMFSALLEIKNAEIDKKRAANEMLPQLDVSGSVFQGGRDHYQSGVFEDIRDRTDNSWIVNVQGSIPIGNRLARGQYEKANLTLREAEQRRERTKQEVMLKVRMAHRALVTSQILVESNRQACKLQETNVAAEEKRLQLGVSTSYRVLQVQEDLTMAQVQELTARITFEKALVDLRLSEGTLLDSIGIEFAPPEPVVPVKFRRSVNPFAKN